MMTDGEIINRVPIAEQFQPQKKIRGNFNQRGCAAPAPTGKSVGSGAASLVRPAGDGHAVCKIYQVQPVIDPAVQNYCSRPYPGHPRGCPNFGKKEGCPPAAPRFDRVFDLSRPVFAVVSDFDLSGHVERLKAAHPAWTERQLRCSLYWQGTVKKALKAAVAEFLRGHPGYAATSCPESMGVNVAETLLSAGLKLEWPPLYLVRLVALCAARPNRDDQR